jgi:hypothetical protein
MKTRMSLSVSGGECNGLANGGGVDSPTFAKNGGTSSPVKTGPELTGVHLTKSGPVRVSVHVSLSQKMSAFQMKSKFLHVESELI